MCQAKAQGGRRCAAHAVGDYTKAIFSKRATPETVKAKASDVIVSPVGKTYYEDKGSELVTVGAENAEKANRNAAFLKAAKFHQEHLAQPIERDENLPEMDYMTETEKAEYSRFVSDEQRKDWWNKKAKEDKAIMEESAKEWRDDPSSYYDRLSMPSEHADLVTKKDLPEDYLRILAVTTKDRNVRRIAVRRYAELKGVTASAVEDEFGEPVYEADKRRDNYITEIEDEKEAEVTRREYFRDKEQERKKEVKKVNRKNAFTKFLKNLWK